jgi:hypothetical protein
MEMVCVSCEALTGYLYSAYYEFQPSITKMTQVTKLHYSHLLTGKKPGEATDASWQLH